MGLVYYYMIGGYLSHIYPRNITIALKNKKIYLPYKYVFFLDIIGHQLPLYILYTQRNQLIKPCGRYFIFPYMFYTIINYTQGHSIGITYGVSRVYLYLAGGTIFTGLSTYYHLLKNKPYESSINK